MTDKEIIKALGCCHITCGCSECAYVDCPEDCVETMKLDALNLINRQKAEIERLREELASKGLKYSLLEREKAEDISGFIDDLKLARAEAIKEFAERLKKEKYSVCAGHGMSECVVSVYDINNLVKEMVGEQK